MPRRLWTREELILTLSVYFQLPFGRPNRSTPDDYSICLSSALLEYETKEYFDQHFGSIAGKRIIMPIEHTPNRDYLAYHREKIFMGI